MPIKQDMDNLADELSDLYLDSEYQIYIKEYPFVPGKRVVVSVMILGSEEDNATKATSLPARPAQTTQPCPRCKGTGRV